MDGAITLALKVVLVLGGYQSGNLRKSFMAFDFIGSDVSGRITKLLFKWEGDS